MNCRIANVLHGVGFGTVSWTRTHQALWKNGSSFQGTLVHKIHNFHKSTFFKKSHFPHYFFTKFTHFIQFTLITFSTKFTFFTIYTKFIFLTKFTFFTNSHFLGSWICNAHDHILGRHLLQCDHSMGNLLHVCWNAKSLTLVNLCRKCQFKILWLYR